MRASIRVRAHARWGGRGAITWLSRVTGLHSRRIRSCRGCAGRPQTCTTVPGVIGSMVPTRIWRSA